MDICADVMNSFIDTRTGVYESCTTICDVEKPEQSPVDCREICPKFYECLVSRMTMTVTHSATVSTTTVSAKSLAASATQAATTCSPQLHFVDHAVYLATIAVLLVLVIVLVAVLCQIKLKLSRRKQRLEDIEYADRDTGKETSRDSLLSKCPGAGEMTTVSSILPPASMVSNGKVVAMTSEVKPVRDSNISLNLHSFGPPQENGSDGPKSARSSSNSAVQTDVSGRKPNVSRLQNGRPNGSPVLASMPS